MTVPARPDPLVARLHLAALPSASCWARRHTAQVLLAWNLDAYVVTATVAVTELVAHATAPMGVRAPRRYVELATLRRIVLTLTYTHARNLAGSPGLLLLDVWGRTQEPPRPRLDPLTSTYAPPFPLLERCGIRWSHHHPPSGGTTIRAELTGHEY